MLGSSAGPPTERVPLASKLTSTGAPGAEGKLPSPAGAPRSTAKTPDVVNVVPAHWVVFDMNVTHRPSFERTACELASPATPLVVTANLEMRVVVPAIVSRTY